MRFKFAALLIGLSVVLTFGLISTVSKQEPQEPAKDRIQWTIDKAKAKGQRRVLINGDTVDYVGSGGGDIEEMFAYTTSVIAVPVEHRTYETDRNIITWYKLRPVEYLSDVRPSGCPSCDTVPPPADLLPADPGEFFIRKQGGTINRDGVQVSQVDYDFPALTEGQRYLMFIYLHPSGVAWVAAGPVGIYTIIGDDRLVSLNNEPHPLKDDLRQKFGSSLREVKAKIKKTR